MSATTWVRWFWSDYNADTAHLDLMQLGAYQRLLGYIYQRRQPLPGDLDKIYRLAHATSAMEQTAVQQVLTEYFIHDTDPERGNCWRHLRAERELEESANFQRGKRIGALKTNYARYGDEASRLELERLGIKVAERVAERAASDVDSESHPQPQPHKDKTHASHESAVAVAPTRAAPCPYEEIRKLWSEVLPELQQPIGSEHWTDARKAMLRARWRDQLPDLDAWRQCFELIRQSDFLMGRTHARGRKPFQASLFWVAKPENLLKIYEGKYA